MFKKTYPSLAVIFVGLSLLFSSCTKSKSNPAAIVPIDKTIALNSSTNSAKDTLFVARDKATALLKVSAAKPAGNDLKRLYVFKRILDPANIGNYETLQIPGSVKDGNNNYYYEVPSGEKDTTNIQVTVELRVNTPAAVMDEFYFVYTNNADYAGPTSSTGVIIGPAQFFVVYGKLSLYPSIRIYNSFTNTVYLPGLDVVNMVFKATTDAAADIDIYENTDDNATFLGKFESKNNTSFVKASQNFPYANATDKVVEAAYLMGIANAFTETPDSVKIGDIYLMQLRGDNTKYAAMKILYLVPENGLTGAGHDNEYILFSVRK